MNNLDDAKIYQKLDPTQCVNDILNSADQIELAWNDVKNFIIPSYYLKVKNIVLMGMGGSGIGTVVTRSLGLYNCKIPIICHADYNIPAFVDTNSLVGCISFSGNTEEPLTALEQAAKKGAKCFGIGSGGKLKELATKYHFPFFCIKYKAVQPRLSFPSQFSACVSILSKLGYIDLNEDDIKKTVKILRELNLQLNPQVKKNKNEAKKIALKIIDKIPIIIGSGYLAEIAKKVKGQFNENSKTASFWEVLPEMNHTSLVGLEFPKKLGEKIIFIILQSVYDHPRNVLRQNIMQNIFRKANIKFELIGGFCIANPYCEIMQFVLFTDYVSYYLGILNGINPESIDAVNYLKDQLAKHK